MRVLDVVGLVLGSVLAGLVGAVLGFGLGVACGWAFTRVVPVSRLEGSEGLLVFQTFGGLGLVAGATLGIGVVVVPPLLRLVRALRAR